MTFFSMDTEHPIIIPCEEKHIDGILHVPAKSKGLVLFVHGSGSSRYSMRNQFVARVLNESGLATLLFDLLTPQEEAIDSQTFEFRFDIEFLTQRLLTATEWVTHQPFLKHLSLGYFGASTGGGAALVAASRKNDLIKSVVVRGGRPDLAGEALKNVLAPTLLIVGGNDTPVIELNRQAMQKLQIQNKLEIIPGASHLFEEPGALNRVADYARKWFEKYLTSA